MRGTYNVCRDVMRLSRKTGGGRLPPGGGKDKRKRKSPQRQKGGALSVSAGTLQKAVSLTPGVGDEPLPEEATAPGRRTSRLRYRRGTRRGGLSHFRIGGLTTGQGVPPLELEEEAARIFHPCQKKRGRERYGKPSSSLSFSNRGARNKRSISEPPTATEESRYTAEYWVRPRSARGLGTLRSILFVLGPRPEKPTIDKRP